MTELYNTTDKFALCPLDVEHTRVIESAARTDDHGFYIEYQNECCVGSRVPR